MSDLPTNVLLLFISALAFICIIRNLDPRGKRKLPPGPRGLPFFGVFFQLSRTPWNEAEAWARQYGPLCYVTAAGQRMLFLNSHQAVSELFDRRAQNYSDRPRSIVANEILTNGLGMILTSYGDFWRRTRRAAHETMTKARVKEYFPFQSRQAIRMVDGMLRNPTNWENDVHLAVTCSILSVLYDIPELKSTNDDLFKRLDEYCSVLIAAAAPGAHLVDFFPWMKHIPASLAKWKRVAEERYKKFSNLFTGLLHDVDSRINEGDERPSVIGNLIRDQQRLQVSKEESVWLGAAL